MGINTIKNNSIYQTAQAAQSAKAAQAAQTGPTSQARQTAEEESSNRQTQAAPALPHDEYVRGEKEEPIGLYQVVPDENGNPKVKFDKNSEQCTTNTDKVDREIKKLREKKEELEQQINAAAGDPEKVRQLERKLAEIELELSQKDNDGYRRQHAVVCNSSDGASS